jgi:hypothetical protein
MKNRESSTAIPHAKQDLTTFQKLSNLKNYQACKDGVESRKLFLGKTQKQLRNLAKFNFQGNRF